MSKNLNILPTLNFGNTGAQGNVVKTVGNTYNSIANTINDSLNSLKGDLGQPIKDSLQNSLSENGSAEGILIHAPMLIALGVLTVCVILYVSFKSQVDAAVSNVIQKIREAMGLSVPTVVAPEPPSEVHVEAPPPPPVESIIPPQIEKILPPNKQVFNIASNIYTYADAAPLCKALGAELATYEQVKEAYQRGADWCNYGWVKGQAAVYPTQKETYDKLQQGPEDQRGACGQIGVNGGYFDNPGLRFGVNCYGTKPAESAHSVEIITQGAGEPITPEAILFDKKVKKYAAEADTIGILPFKKGDWSS